MNLTIYAIAFDNFVLHRLDIGLEIDSDMRGRGGAYEIPPSCDWPSSIENKLISKPREARLDLYHHHKCHHCCHGRTEKKFR